MRNPVLTGITVGIFTLLSACHQSEIQGDYHDISGACKGVAETTVAATSTTANKAARNAELVTVFSDCMAKKGWAVATPKRARNPGFGSKLSPSGSPAMTQPNAAQNTAPEPTAATTMSPTPSINTQYQYNQPVVQPVGQSGYSVYQPAYPAPEAGVTPPAPTPAQSGTPARRY